MIVNTSLAALATGEQVQLSVGDILRVTVGFKYTAAEDTVITLRACPYHYVVGVLNRVGGSCSETDIELERAATTTLKETTVDMPIVPAAEGGVSDGTYGLIVEILGTDVEDHIDDCLVIGGNPTGMMEMIGPLLVLGLMAGMVAMMAPMMKEGFAEAEK